jgi:hypothetical protein
MAILRQWGMDMVSDKCRMETMAIAIISNINLIVDMTSTENVGNIVNVNMAEKVEAMDSIDGTMTTID